MADEITFPRPAALADAWRQVVSQKPATKRLFDIISKKLVDACGHSFTLNLTELDVADEDAIRLMTDRLDQAGWAARVVREPRAIQMHITPTSYNPWGPRKAGL